MFFDLISYKIRILKPHTVRTAPGGLRLPIDVPGTVLGLETKNANIIQNYIKKNRLLEVLCGKDKINRGRADVFIRWDNDIKLWHYVGEEFMLLSTNYPIFRSIWYHNGTPIVRDFRPAHERIPVTIMKRRRPPTFARKASKSMLKSYAEMYGAEFKEAKTKLFDNDTPDMPEEVDMTQIELPLDPGFVSLEGGSDLTSTVSSTRWTTYTNTDWYDGTNYVISTGGSSS
jgi:hypothetical protein